MALYMKASQNPITRKSAFCIGQSIISCLGQKHHQRCFELHSSIASWLYTRWLFIIYLTTSLHRHCLDLEVYHSTNHIIVLRVALISTVLRNFLLQANMLPKRLEFGIQPPIPYLLRSPETCPIIVSIDLSWGSSKKTISPSMTHQNVCTSTADSPERSGEAGRPPQS